MIEHMPRDSPGSLANTAAKILLFALALALGLIAIVRVDRLQERVLVLEQEPEPVCPTFDDAELKARTERLAERIDAIVKTLEVTEQRWGGRLPRLIDPAYRTSIDDWSVE